LKTCLVSANKHISEILDKRLFLQENADPVSLLRDIYLLKLDFHPFLINLDLVGLLDKLGQSTSLDRIQRATSILWHLERGASRNLNKNLALDQFVFELSGEYSGLTQKNFS
jgi:hypothetical protein